MPPSARPSSRPLRPPSSVPTTTIGSPEEHNNMTQRQLLMEQIGSMIRLTAAPLRHHKHAYVEPKMLKSLGVVCCDSNIDFDTGKVPRGSTQYLRPVSAATIQEDLKPYKPWNLWLDFCNPDEEEPLGHDMCTRIDPQHDAANFGRFIHNWLQFGQTDDEFGILEDTLWADLGLNQKYMTRMIHGEVDWQVKWIFRRYSIPYHHLPCGAQLHGCDPNLPHITGFMTTNAQFKEDKFFTSEVDAMVLVAAQIAMGRLDQGHKLYPITLVSGAGRKARIVQGIVDFGKGKMEIRKSRVVSFEGGARKSKQELMTVLGWLIGLPMGATR